MGLGACGGERTLDPGGQTESHCCYLAGEVCPALTDWDGTVACAFMLLADGDWNTVYADPGYTTWVKPHLLSRGITLDCGDWPGSGTCGDCGLTGGGMGDGVTVSLAPNEKNAVRRALADRLEAWEATHPPPGG